MQKLRSKLGLLVVFSCLTLAFGLMASTTGSASAHQAGSRHRPQPRITMRVLSGHFRYHGHYVERAVIYGVGFNGCDSCESASTYDGCPSACNSNCHNACSASSCSYYNANACGSSSVCSSACGSADGCPSACGNGGVGNSGISVGGRNGVSVGNGSVSVGGRNGVVVGNGSVSVGGSPSCSSACGGASGNVSGGTSCSSYDGCSSGSSCDCANVQSSIPIYGQSANLSRVPVNAFGEFQVTVLILVPVHPAKVHYRMWAINRYNDDCSNILSGSQNW